jgi:hypothetical protein
MDKAKRRMRRQTMSMRSGLTLPCGRVHRMLKVNEYNTNTFI